MKKHVRSQGRIVILSGPSGAGKTTLQDMLLKSEVFRDKIERSISMTTRQARGEEQHGKEYCFISKKMFEYKIKAGHFLEWAKVCDNYYGTPQKNVRNILRQGRSVLLCIDVQGGLQVKQRYSNVLMIFITTPDMTVLRHRLEKRNTDSKESIKRRLAIAKREQQQSKYYQYIIVNKHLESAFIELVKILEQEIGKSRVR